MDAGEVGVGGNTVALLPISDELVRPRQITITGACQRALLTTGNKDMLIQTAPISTGVAAHTLCLNVYVYHLKMRPAALRH